MANKRNIHIVKNAKKWNVKREGNADPISTHRTQAAAEEAGRRRARADRVELVTHRPDGRIRDKDSYGPDPHPPKDTKH